MTEAEDKYRCIKVRLKTILCKDDLVIEDLLQDAVERTNRITIKTYMLLRCWILKKYHNDTKIPTITEDTIRMAMKSIVKPSCGPKTGVDNTKLFLEFQELNIFPREELEDGKNLSQVLSYYRTTMITSIENNIKMHFIDRVKNFITRYFKKVYDQEIKDSIFKKQFYKEINVLFKDIIEGTSKSGPRFLPWLSKNRFKIVPKEYKENYYYDLKVDPQKYLKYMIFMSIELEKKGCKLFQIFPLQTDIIPKSIEIDTAALIHIFIKNSSDYGKNIEDSKDIVWPFCFNITQKIKNYTFDYAIITDGYSVSLRFINNKYVSEQNIIKAKMKEGRRKASKAKNTTTEVKTVSSSSTIVSIPKEQNFKKPQKIKTVEYSYIDEVPKEELKGKHIFIDPGKRSLFTMMDDEGNFMSYTNGDRITSTKRLRYQRLIQNYKDSLDISSKENELTSYNSKTCFLDKFKEYIDKKIEVNNSLYKKYQKEKFRQYKWYAYINTKRTEDKMLNKISDKFGTNSIIIIGDWSVSKQMRNFISTPNISLKRKLKERFKIYNIDEYRTSILHHRTEEKCENLYLLDAKNRSRKKHSILTYKMENNRKGCINRDRNGCKNIQKIFKSYMETGEVPLKYRRSYKFPD